MRFEIFDIDEYKNSSKKIIVYGTDWMSFLVGKVLKHHDITDIKYSNYDARSMFFTENVNSFNELLSDYSTDEYIILWAVAEYSFYESEEFIRNGITMVYSVRKLFEELNLMDYPELNDYLYEFEKREDFFFFEDVLQKKDKVFIYSIDAMVTEKCTLRCKDCSNLMQYYKKPINYNVDEANKYLSLLLDKVDRLHDIRILGGEPFINKEFIKIIDAFVDNEKVDRITILSNGTIFPDYEILNKLKNKKIVLRLSDYDEYSKSLTRIVEWAKENGVRYQVSKMDLWQDTGRLMRHDYSVMQLKDIYGNCECRNTPTIIGNRLYNCAYAANASNLGAMMNEEESHDYLLLDGNLTGRDIDKFLYERPYLEACRYCGGRNQNRSKVPPHIQTHIPLDYEILQNLESSCDNRKAVKEAYNFEEIVSIVVPMYNASGTIDKCINSIINQDYPKIELILIDDGSEDDTVKKCVKYLKYKNAECNILLLEKKHMGVVKARNEGIDIAHGKYITFVDSDDWIEKEHIKRLVLGMEEGQNEMCFDNWFIDRKSKKVADSQFDRGQSMFEIQYGYPTIGVYTNKEILQLMIDYMVIKWDGIFDPMWNKMYITEKMRKISNKIDYRISFGEDRLYNLFYLLNCTRIRVIDYVGYHYTTPVRSEFERKYDLDSRVKELRYIRSTIDDNVGGMDSVALEISNAILCRQIDSIIGIAQNSKKFPTVFYYPYYGRFDKMRVVLYGAGDVGQSYFRSIQKDDKKELVAWIDINANKIQREKLFPVKGVEYFDEISFDIVLVAVFTESLYKKIKNDLIKKGIGEEKIIWNPTKKMALFL